MLHLKLLLLLGIAMAGQLSPRLVAPSVVRKTDPVAGQQARAKQLQKLLAELEQVTAEREQLKAETKRFEAELQKVMEQRSKRAESKLQKKNAEVRRLIEEYRRMKRANFVEPGLRPSRLELQPINLQPRRLLPLPPIKIDRPSPPQIDDLPALGPLAAQRGTPMSAVGLS